MFKLTKILLLFILVFPTALLGQTDILKTRITIHSQSLTAKQFINTVSEEYGINFSYNDDLLPKNEIQIEAMNSVPLEKVFNDIFGVYHLGLKQVGTQVVIYVMEKPVNEYYLSGFIKDKETGESLIGVAVVINEHSCGVVTNAYGYYSLKLDESVYNISYSYLGYETQIKRVELNKSLKHNIELNPSNIFLNEVVVYDKDSITWINKNQETSTGLSMKILGRIPGLFGESDVTRSISMLPGIFNNEVSSGNIYVRGGNSDQTLFLMDDARIFNAAHFGGFFSIFNPEIVNDVQVYKSDMPVSEFGAISSLIDVRLREGNTKKWQVKGGIGLIDAKASVEGPLVKDHTSMLLSFRRTYIDGLLKLLNANIDPDDLNFYFYDANLKLNTTINTRNRLFLSVYTGTDYFTLINNLKRVNQTANIRWNHVFGPKLFLNTSLIFSRTYFHQISIADNYPSKWSQDIYDLQAKATFSYYTSAGTKMYYGMGVNFTSIQPFKLKSLDSLNLYQSGEAHRELSITPGVFFNINHNLTSWIAVDGGVRLGYFMNPNADIHNGPKYRFSDVNSPFSETYGKLIVEPRFYTWFNYQGNTSYYLGYNRQVNPLHQLELNDIGLTIARLIPSSINYKPQISDNISAGFQNSSFDWLKLSADIYYRKMHNLYETLRDQRLLFAIEADDYTREAKGYATGLEVALNVKTGNYFGIYSFEHARVMWKSAGINQEQYYPSMHSHPNSVSITNSFKFGRRTTVSLMWKYHTGLPYTPVAGIYELNGNKMPYLDENGVNSKRMPDYHRLDISVDLEGKKNHIRKWKSFWNFSVYNAYFQKNALGVVYFSPDENSQDAHVFKPRYFYLYQFVPSVSYKFVF